MEMIHAAIIHYQLIMLYQYFSTGLFLFTSELPLNHWQVPQQVK